MHDRAEKDLKEEKKEITKMPKKSFMSCLFQNGLHKFHPLCNYSKYNKCIVSVKIISYKYSRNMQVIFTIFFITNFVLRSYFVGHH